jgi:hypothetical protein
MIVAMDGIVHLDQITRTIGIGAIVDILRVAIRTDMTIDPEVEHAARLPGGRWKGIFDVAMIVPDGGEMTVATDIIEVNESKRNTMTAYPHHEITTDPATIDHHHRQGNTTATLTTITRPNLTSLGHQQWIWHPVPPHLALRLHLHLAHLNQVATQWTNKEQPG